MPKVKLFLPWLRKHLNKKSFPDLLNWCKNDWDVFEVAYQHGNSRRSTQMTQEQAAAVWTAWAKTKKASSKVYGSKGRRVSSGQWLTTCRQRFRQALKSLVRRRVLLDLSKKSEKFERYKIIETSDFLVNDEETPLGNANNELFAENLPGQPSCLSLTPDQVSLTQGQEESYQSGAGTSEETLASVNSTIMFDSENINFFHLRDIWKGKNLTELTSEGEVNVEEMPLDNSNIELLARKLPGQPSLLIDKDQVSVTQDQEESYHSGTGTSEQTLASVNSATMFDPDDTNLYDGSNLKDILQGGSLSELLSEEEEEDSPELAKGEDMQWLNSFLFCGQQQQL